MREEVQNTQHKALTKAENIIFLSRWMQAPMYFGLIVAIGAYGVKFFQELWHLITQIAIHMTFVVSVLALAFSEKLSKGK